MVAAGRVYGDTARFLTWTGLKLQSSCSWGPHLSLLGGPERSVVVTNPCPDRSVGFQGQAESVAGGDLLLRGLGREPHARSSEFEEIPCTTSLPAV